MRVNHNPTIKNMPNNRVQVRDVQISIILDWLHAGILDAHQSGKSSLFYGIVLAGIGILIHHFFAGNYWLLAGLTTGFFLLGPFLAMGLYDLSRRIEQGESPALIPTLTAWCPNVLNIAIFAILLLVVLLIWTWVSMNIFAYYFNGAAPTFMDVVLNVIKLKQPIFTLIYFAVGGFFAVLVYAISVIAMPLMLDQNANAMTAALTSLRACARNPLTMLFWAFFIVVLIGFGLATNFLGLILTMPVVGHASWHAYRGLIASKI